MHWILLITLALIWGSSFILIKWGLIGFAALDVGLLRISLAALVMLPFSLRAIGKIDRKAWFYLACVGVIGSLLPAIFFAIAITKIDSSLAGILNATQPFFALLMGALFFNLAIYNNQKLGIIIGFIGVVFLFIPEGGKTLTFNGYAIIVLAATACYGISTNIIKKHLHHISALTVASVSLLIAGTASFLYLLFTENFSDIDFMDKPFISILILGGLGTGLALVIFNRLIQSEGIVFASNVTYLIPIVAIGWGVHESEGFTLLRLIGVAIILAGLLYSSRKPYALKAPGN